MTDNTIVTLAFFSLMLLVAMAVVGIFYLIQTEE